MLGRLDGKVAIISGAGSCGPGIGVGRATAVLFARAGARLVLVDVKGDRAVETQRLLAETGADTVIVEVDVTEADSPRRIVDAAVERFGTVDILVNNAAISPLVGILDAPSALYDTMVATNLTAPYRLTQTVLPVMQANGGGAITNITSVAAFRGTGVSQTAYSASKAGLLGMMVDVACSYGGYGIRVNCVSPGHIDTPMRTAVAQDAGIDVSALDAGAHTALGFEGDAWDIARAVLFLSSPDARYITGVHLPVDGGTSVRNP